MVLKARFCLLLTALALLFLPGCSLLQGPEHPPSSSIIEENRDENFPVTVDGVTLEDVPNSVISLSPALTELVCDLGFSGRLIAISDYCDTPGLPGDLPRVGTVTSPDLAAMKRLKPDVLLVPAALTAADSAALEEYGVPVIVLPRAQTVEELSRLYTELGQVLAGAPAGQAIGETFYNTQIEALNAIAARITADGEDAPEVCYLRSMPLVLATGDTFEGDLLARAGFHNSGGAYTGWSYPDDKKADLMPDIIFYDEAVGSEALAATELYSTTPAYQNGKCYELDMDSFERQGARMFGLLGSLANEALGAGDPE